MSELKVNEVNIDFKVKNLLIKVDYEQTQSIEEEAQLKDFFQWRFSERFGKPVPIEQIHVRPRAGEQYSTSTFFTVEDGKPLYFGVRRIHRGNPNALPWLVRCLNFCKGFSSSPEQLRLIDWATQELEAIVNSKNSGTYG